MIEGSLEVKWVRSAIRDSQQPSSPRGSYSETSATALCGTTGSLNLKPNFDQPDFGRLGFGQVETFETNS
jgi:hypothetical protein